MNYLVLYFYMILCHYYLYILVNSHFVGKGESLVSSRKLSDIKYHGELAVRITVSYDTALLTRFNNNTSAVHEYIYRTVASVNSTYRHSNMKMVADFKFLLMNISYYNNSMKGLPIGTDYKSDFCGQVKEFRSLKLTAAIIITGHNFIFHETDVNTFVQGLAIPGAICTSSIGCLIVEGRSFRAAFVMAHELAHMFGIKHDDSSCGNTKFLMSTSTGEQKNIWSHCSITNFNVSLTEKFNRNEEKFRECFSPNPELDSKALTIPEQYLSTTVDHQCAVGLGDIFYHYTTTDSQSSVCDSIYCTNGVYKIRIDPALENTPCADKNFTCFEGQCRPSFN